MQWLMAMVDGMITCYIGLGANLGQPRQTLAAAHAALAQLPHTRLITQSGLYASKPIDSSGDDYLNAVVAIDTILPAPALLDRLQAIELAHGRERPYRNAPRTLDLDLLLYGDQQLASERLTLPHPRLHLRAFVLMPLLEIAPHITLPGLGPAVDFMAGVRKQEIRWLADWPVWW